MSVSRCWAALAAGLLWVFGVGGCASTSAGLESWNEGPARDRIVRFVEGVSTPGSASFVPEAERVAVFDNDGTLWSEHPMYVQLAYVLDRVREMSSEHPEWSREEPFRSALAGDLKGVAAGGEAALMKLLAATHAGMTTEAFERSVTSWIERARHPETGRLYTEMVYAPMLELIDYLHANGFRVFIVSGGGIEFMRPWTERVYGIPRERVVGSSLELLYDVRDGSPVLVKRAEVNLNDDKSGKPVGIMRHIGRRPILAGGNSDGDFEMLEFTTLSHEPSLGLLVHHDDAAREAAYDRESHVGRLDRGLDEAGRRGWLVVSMRNDWSRVFAGDR